MRGELNLTKKENKINELRVERILFRARLFKHRVEEETNNIKTNW